MSLVDKVCRWFLKRILKMDVLCTVILSIPRDRFGARELADGQPA